MADRTLLTLFDEVRGKTLALLDGVGEPESLWAPQGLHNSIRWHAGHCYVVVEWLCADALELKPTAPTGWFEMFGWESRPQNVPPERWPTLSTVIAQLTEQHRRLHMTLERLAEEQLATALPESRHQTVRRKIVHAIHDEACHSGEIWLLRKMLDRLRRSEE